MGFCQLTDAHAQCNSKSASITGEVKLPISRWWLYFCVVDHGSCERPFFDILSPLRSLGIVVEGISVLHVRMRGSFSFPHLDVGVGVEGFASYPDGCLGSSVSLTAKPTRQTGTMHWWGHDF